MVNFNGSIESEDSNLLVGNRAFMYGDAVFETVKIVAGKVLFLEDHYFRLMSSMRIVRMEIPMNFTMEYFEEQLVYLVKAEKIDSAARARMTVFRNYGGYYLPLDRTVSFLITAEKLESPIYQTSSNSYVVDLYTDLLVSTSILSTLKTTNKLINICASIFASENNFDNCLLLNDSKLVVEALQGNVFMLSGNTLITPPVTDGCLDGVMRKQIIRIAKGISSITVQERSISPFELQKADEIFITNVIRGIQSISKYRQKTYSFDFSSKLVAKLNEFSKV